MAQNLFFSDVLIMQGCHRAYIRSADLLRKFSPRNWITIMREKEAVKNAKLIVAVSNLVKKQLIQEYFIDPQKIEVIYNGINFKEFYFERKFNNLNKEINLLFVRNYFRRKGLKELLIALSLIKNKEFKLLVVGKDNTNPYIKLSKKLGILNKINFWAIVKMYRNFIKRVIFLSFQRRWNHVH